MCRPFKNPSTGAVKVAACGVGRAVCPRPTAVVVGPITVYMPSECSTVDDMRALEFSAAASSDSSGRPLRSVVWGVGGGTSRNLDLALANATTEFNTRNSGSKLE